MPPLAYFGIESSGLNLVVDLLILFVVVLYLATIYWTYADARRRIVDPMLVGCATAAALFPFVGPIVYMVLRPPEYLDDVRERELEMRAAEARLHQLDQLLCPHCDARVERDFIRCPSCLRKLKERCAQCSRPLERSWTICPYCEADGPGLGSPRPRRRRSAATESGLPEASERTESMRHPLAPADVRTPIAPEEARSASAPEEQAIPERQSRVASKAASRPLSAGRSSRPSGRTRPGT